MWMHNKIVQVTPNSGRGSQIAKRTSSNKFLPDSGYNLRHWCKYSTEHDENPKQL